MPRNLKEMGSGTRMSWDQGYDEAVYLQVVYLQHLPPPLVVRGGLSG